MAQYKKAIFIGRDAPDTGLDEYRRLARLKKIKLDEYIGVPNAARHLPKYDMAFVSGYLAILEALEAGVAVFAYYNNEIKKDYLQMAPFTKFITIFSSFKEAPCKADESRIMAGQKWAKSQTWDKLTDIYEKLWQK